MALYQSLAPGYENVHRGQSSASRQMTALFEESYDTIAQFIGAPGRASLALYRNTTEAITRSCTRCSLAGPDADLGLAGLLSRLT